MDEIRFEFDCDTSVPHFHGELEILYVLTGRCAVMTAKNNYLLSSEDFAVYNPYEHHEIYREAGAHTVSAYISLPILQQANLGRVKCCSKLQPDQADYLSMIRMNLAVVFKEVTDSPDLRRLQILSHLFGLLAILKSQFELPESYELHPTQEIERIQKVLIYIGQHFSEELSLQTVSDLVHLSKSQLSRDFHKILRISFSDYLRQLRLNKAEYLLRTKRQSVTDIALECGFSNTNTFILNFRQQYHITPGNYRRCYEKQASPQPQEGIAAISGTLSYMNLLKYAAKEEAVLPLNKRSTLPTRIEIDARENLGKLQLHHNDSTSLGWAEQLLHEEVRDAVRDSVKTIGFQSVLFFGIFDDSLDFYHEDKNGRPWLSFTYIDLILDFLVDLNITLQIQLGYTPKLLTKDRQHVFGNSCIGLPDNLEKWKFLVSGFLEHLVYRYGIELVSLWSFTPEQLLFVQYGVFSLEDYLYYYETTWKILQKQLPGAMWKARVFDIDFLSVDGFDILYRFLDYCRQKSCLPTQLSVQSFCMDHAKYDRAVTENRIQAKMDQQPGEPAPISADESVLQHRLQKLRSCLDEYGYSDLPISVFGWNTTLWQNDLGNDTCFKAAAVVKHCLESRNLVTAMAMAHLTDNSERRVMNSNPYHGGYGILNYYGIPKAAYYAMMFLTLLKNHGDIILAEGDGYIVTRSGEGRKLQILLYHYCHYDEQNHLTEWIPLEEQRTIDRYMGFVQKGTRSFAIHLQNMIPGNYLKRSFSVNREHGSSYDQWMTMGAPDLQNRTQKLYLTKISTYGALYENVLIGKSGSFNLSTVLDEHEVRLILLEKR